MSLNCVLGTDSMKLLQKLKERMRAVHWILWVVWFISLVLLGLVIARHHTTKVTEMAEAFRYSWGLLPIHIVIHRNLAEGAGYTMLFSVLLAIAAIERPANAPILLPLAIGLTLIFFAIHMLLYSQLMTLWMESEISRRHTIP